MDKILEQGSKEPDKEKKEAQDLALLGTKLDKIINLLTAQGKIQFASLILREHPNTGLAQEIKVAVLEEGEEWARRDFRFCEGKKSDSSQKNQSPQFPSFFVRRDKREAP